MDRGDSVAAAGRLRRTMELVLSHGLRTSLTRRRCLRVFETRRLPVVEMTMSGVVPAGATQLVVRSNSCTGPNVWLAAMCSKITRGISIMGYYLSMHVSPNED